LSEKIDIIIINDSLFICREKGIIHTSLKNTNWNQVKNAIIREFLENDNEIRKWIDKDTLKEWIEELKKK